MKAAVISLGSISRWLPSHQNTSETVDELDLKDIEVELGLKNGGVLSRKTFENMTVSTRRAVFVLELLLELSRRISLHVYACQRASVYCFSQ